MLNSDAWATDYAGAPTPWPFCFSYPVGGTTGRMTYQGIWLEDGIAVENGVKLMEILNDRHAIYVTQQVQATWEEAASVAEQWAATPTRFETSADFGAKVMAGKIAEELRRRAIQEGK